MAPKRARAGPSTQPEQPLSIEEKMLACKFLPEKEFPFDQAEEFCRIATNTYHLGHLMKAREEGNETLVQEFYIQAAKATHLRFKLRGQQVHVTPQLIRQVLQLPEVPNCRYKYLKKHKTEISMDEVASNLDFAQEVHWKIPRGGQSYIERVRLHREARIWLHFLANNLIPTLHRSNLTWERALLLFLLKTQQPVDISAVIYVALNSTIDEHSIKICFPYLICSMCEELGVPTRQSDRTFQPVLAFRYSSIKVLMVTPAADPTVGDEDDEMTDIPLEPDEEEDETGEALASYPSIDELSQRMDGLYTEMGEIRQEVRLGLQGVLSEIRQMNEGMLLLTRHFQIPWPAPTLNALTSGIGPAIVEDKDLPTHD